MTVKKQSIGLLKRVVVACFFAVITLFGFSVNLLSTNTPVYAVERGETTSAVSADNSDSENECKKSFGAVGWLVCPATGKIAEAIDFLYGTLENILVVEPIKIEDGTPIYEIWKYCRGLTNLVFIIMLLVVIFSQITGIGITNYGIKRALPRLIVAAIMINLSFLICSLLVDASNIAGNGIRGIFTGIAESAMTANSTTTTNIGAGDIFASVAAGSLVVFGVSIALVSGAFYLLVPALFGMLASILIGLFTIALRQVVVALLVMIAPLAIVANILPNTENLFQKWKSNLTQMLVFYPMFSLLFGASNLAGFAIVASSDNVLGVMLGMVVQVLPLIFSWNLMKMSGSALGSLNSWLHGLAGSLGQATGIQAWAESSMARKRQRTIAEGNRYRPSIALLRFVNNRRERNEIEANEYAEYNRNRAMSQHAKSHYRKDGTVSRKGERAYARQAENTRFQEDILRDQNTFDNGLGGMGRGTRQNMRLKRLDIENMNAADSLHVEKARSEWIKRDNDRGRFRRFEKAREANLEELEGYETNPDTGEKRVKPGYNFDNPEHIEAMARYNTMLQIMNNDERATEYAVAVAASNNEARMNAIGKELYTSFKNVPSAKTLRAIIANFSNMKDAAEHMDVILPGFRVLNEYGDHDVILQRVKDIVKKDSEHDGLTLGTHASQSLASFLMFEASDKEPFLKRFGNYIVGETFRLYDADNPRLRKDVTYDEYILGYYYEEDPDHPGQMRKALPKRSVSELLKGTSFDGIERAAFENYENSMIEAFTTVDQDGNKHVDMDAYFKRKEEVDAAFMPAFINANMKYMTDSDQLAGSVRLKTGYLTKRNPDTGKPYTVPIWEDPSALASYGFQGHEEELRKYYQKESIKYASMLSPNQVFALRSAYREPLTRHLSDAFMESDARNWSPEEQSERISFMDEFRRQQEILANSHDDAEKAEARTKISNLREKMASSFFRRILNERGTLTQIYETRKSGAANNAKEWVVRWLKMDDLQEINRVQKNNRRSKQNENPPADQVDIHHSPIGSYSNQDMTDFRGKIELLSHDMAGDSMDDFYSAAKRRAKDVFGDASTVALESFEEYYDNHRDDEDREKLINKLIELLTRDLLD